MGLAWGKTHRESLGRFDHATVECTRAPCTPRLRPALPNHRCNPSTSRLPMNVQLNARAGHVLWNASRRRQHRRSIGASPVNPVNPSIRWALEHLLFTLPLQAAPGLWPGVERHVPVGRCFSTRGCWLTFSVGTGAASRSSAHSPSAVVSPPHRHPESAKWSDAPMQPSQKVHADTTDRSIRQLKAQLLSRHE